MTQEPWQFSLKTGLFLQFPAKFKLPDGKTLCLRGKNIKMNPGVPGTFQRCSF